MVSSKVCMVALMIAGSVCLGYTLDEPTIAVDDAGDRVAHAANTALSKSRFPAGRSLLQDTTVGYNDMKDLVLAKTNDIESKSKRVFASRTLLGEGKSDYDRMQTNLEKISQGTSRVADAAQKIEMSVGRRNWVTRHLLGGRQLLKAEIPDTDTVAHKINKAVIDMDFDAERKYASRASSRQLLKEEIPDTDTVSHKINQAVSDMGFNTERKFASRASSRQLLKEEIPDTDTVAHKINQAVSDMGFNTERKFASRASNRQLLQSAVPAPKIIHDTITTKSIDRNKAKIDSGSSDVNNIFAKIASRAGFRI